MPFTDPYKKHQVPQTANGFTADWRIAKALVELVREFNPSGEVYVMESSGEGQMSKTFEIMGYTHENIPGVDRFIGLDETGAFVLTNLLQNATSASKPKGRIHVRSFARESSAWIEVQDNGPGIPAERLNNLFEPEFTVNRGRVEAANWSLYMARGIVADHGGRLQVEGTEGSGTTARMILPAGIVGGTTGLPTDSWPAAH
jgi:signal transduction histidine kinase